MHRHHRTRQRLLRRPSTSTGATLTRAVLDALRPLGAPPLPVREVPPADLPGQLLLDFTEEAA